MAVINNTGITNGGTIQAEHITRAIDALSGVSTDTVIASGSFTGSLVGNVTGNLVGTASTASVVSVTDTTSGTGPYFVAFTDGTTGAQAIRVDSAALTFNATTNVLSTTASFATSGSRAVSASFATTASFALNASSFPFTGSARVTGSLGVTGSLSMLSGSLNLTNGSVTMTGSIALSGNITMNGNLSGFNKASIVDFSNIGAAGIGNFILPLAASQSPATGSIYFRSDTGTLYVYSGTQWLAFQSA